MVQSSPKYYDNMLPDRSDINSIDKADFCKNAPLACAQFEVPYIYRRIAALTIVLGGNLSTICGMVN